jgi:hypothetical protein
MRVTGINANLMHVALRDATRGGIFFKGVPSINPAGSWLGGGTEQFFKCAVVKLHYLSLD